MYSFSTVVNFIIKSKLFIKKLLFQGPTNPDVFQAPDTEKAPKIPEEEKNKHQSLRDSIVKIMNEVCLSFGYHRVSCFSYVLFDLLYVQFTRC